MAQLKGIIKEIIDWENVPDGTFFTAKKVMTRNRKKDIYGIVRKCYGYTYFLTDQVTEDDGMENYKKSGFKSNILMYDGDSICEDRIVDIKLYDTPLRGYKLPESPIFIGDDVVVFYKGYIEVGCQTISNDIVRKILSKLEEK